MNNKLTQSDWDRLILIIKEEYPIVSSSFSEETEDEWAYWEIICRHHDKWDIRIRLEDDEINVSVDDTHDVELREFGSYYWAVWSMDPWLFMLVAWELLSQLNNRY